MHSESMEKSKEEEMPGQVESSNYTVWSSAEIEHEEEEHVDSHQPVGIVPGLLLKETISCLWTKLCFPLELDTPMQREKMLESLVDLQSIWRDF